MPLFLRRSEVSGLLDLRRAMAVLAQTFREQSAGKVKQVAPLRFMNRGMRMVVGALEAQDKNGFRVSVTGGEALAMLFEISSGNLLALMGYPFSNLRISATVGLAIERFTDGAARTVAMIGSGRLALSTLEPAAALRPHRAGSGLQPQRGQARSVRAQSERETKNSVHSRRRRRSERSMRPILSW